MSLTTVQVAIVAAIITGAPLPRARVRFELQAAGVDAGLVVSGTPSTVTLDDTGVGVATLWGGPQAQYAVTIHSESGKLQFTGKATVPAYDCSLHDILDLAPTSVDDAQAAVLKARDWALKIDGPVEGDELSAKSHAQAARSEKEQTQATAAIVQTNLGAIQAAPAHAAIASAQASLAAGYAASANSGAQQDLSGVTAAALHRSPNAITAMSIYSTDKDSDGGAWIEKCSATSWMNEALNGTWRGACASEAACRAISGATTGDYFQLTTDGKFYKLNAGSGTTEVFRGNTAKFPRLSAIVAEAASLTIYDLTQPGRPMWKRFVVGVNNYVRDTAPSIAALNGALLIGTLTSGYSLIEFTRDSGAFRNGSGHYALIGPLAKCNAGLGYSVIPGGASIVGSTVYAVAITTLPDAPLDPAIGLPTPTIAVLTAGGLSVIRQDGTVSNHAFTYSPGFDVGALAFIGGYLLYGSQASSNGPRHIKVADITGAIFTGTAFVTSGIGTGSAATSLAGGLYSAQYTRLYNNARADIFRLNASDKERSLRATITDTYNTGFRIGDERRCLMADTVAGTSTGTELVTNGTFSTDTSGWSATQSCTLSAVSGSMRVTATGSIPIASYAVTTVPGKTYTVAGTLAANPAGRNNFVTARATAGGTPLATGVLMTLGSPVSLQFTAVGTTSYIAVEGVSTYVNGETFDVDNISCKEVAADRSYKAKPLTIIGTLARTAVATAAQLVAYSGWSNSNYLREAYSADLDFGTAAWSGSAWVSAPVPTSLPLATPGAFPYIGGEILTNGDFSSGSTGWTVAGNDATHIITFSGGAMRFQSDTTTPQLIITQPNAMANGLLYEVTVVTSATNGGSLKSDQLVDRRTGGTIVIGDVVGTKTLICTGANLAGGINFTRNAANVDVTIDSISIKQIGPSTIAERAYSTGPKFNLGMDAIGRITASAYDGTTTRSVQTTQSYNLGVFLKARVEYTTDGSLTLKVNGRQVAQTTGAPLLTLNNSNAVLTIGNDYSLVSAFPGSITLVKFSATVPPSEQSQWMYEQEKEMFRDGAQVTLPDAGAVVDLTYDEATDKWTTASAAYESSWSGLVRTSSAPASAGSIIGCRAASGIKLIARSTTNPGVDVTIPAYGLREELVKRGERAAALSRPMQPFDFDATAGQTDFALPVGYTAVDVKAAGAFKREGPTKDYTRLFDGFKETIRFGAGQAGGTWVQLSARRV